MTTWAPDKRQGSSFTVWHHFPSSLRPFLSVPINVRSLFLFFFIVFLKADADSSVAVDSAHTFKRFKIQMQDAGFAVRFSLASPRENIMSEHHTSTLTVELLLKANSVLTQSLNAGRSKETWPCSERRWLGVTSLLQLRAAGLEQTAETTENHYFH